LLRIDHSSLFSRPTFDDRIVITHDIHSISSEDYISGYPPTSKEGVP
jgi:hypothetical protein